MDDMGRAREAATSSGPSSLAVPNLSTGNVPGSLRDWLLVASILDLTGPYVPGDRYGLSGYYSVSNPLHWSPASCMVCGELVTAEPGGGLEVTWYSSAAEARWFSGVCDGRACLDDVNALTSAWTLVDSSRLVTFTGPR